jgi:hypothetical protein
MENLNPDPERLRIEQRRLELDEQKAKIDQRFLNRNFAAVTTLAVGLVGVLLSAAQIWVAYIQKERELLQKQHESVAEEFVKQRDFDLQEKRDLRGFVVQNYAHIFSDDASERDRMKNLLLSTYSAVVVQPVFDGLFAITSKSQQSTWAQARVEATAAAVEQAKPTVYVHDRGAGDAQLIDEVMKSLTEAGYRVQPKQRVVQPTNGDVRYFRSNEADQASALATLVAAKLKAAGWNQTMTPLSLGHAFPNSPAGVFEVWIPDRPK